MESDLKTIINQNFKNTNKYQTKSCSAVAIQTENEYIPITPSNEAMQEHIVPTYETIDDEISSSELTEDALSYIYLDNYINILPSTCTSENAQLEFISKCCSKCI